MIAISSVLDAKDFVIAIALLALGTSSDRMVEIIRQHLATH